MLRAWVLLQVLNVQIPRSRPSRNQRMDHSSQEFARAKLTKYLLGSTRKPIERGDLMAGDVDVALVDFVPKIGHLGLEVCFLDVDMP